MIWLVLACTHGRAPLERAAAPMQWWEHAAPCPDGATLQGAPPPMASRVWCGADTGDGFLVPHGADTVFGVNGAVVIERGWDMGRYDGGYTTFFDDGQVKQTGRFSMDAQVGAWSAYFPSGQLRSRVQFVDGVLDGLSERWHDTGHKALEQPFSQGLTHGTLHAWGTDGRLLGSRTLVHGTGVYTEWHPTGHRANEGHMVSGRLDGEWLFWTDDGRLASVEHYADDVMHGAFTYFGPEGQVLGTFEMTHGSGTWMGWHDNGALAAQGPMVGELRQGTWTYFDDQGNPVLEQDWAADSVVDERPISVAGDGAGER